MAERHFVNGGVNLLWGTAGNWSLTEGGAGGQVVPTAAEDVFFDAGSPDCTINSQTRVAKTLTTSAYTHTLTFTYGITVSGNITIGANTLFDGSTASRLTMLVAGTWTTNGKTIPQSITIGDFTAGTVTLAGDLTTSADLTLSNATSTTFSGNFHITAATCSISGTQTVTIVHDVTISGLTTIATTTVLDGLFNWNTAGLTTTGALSGTTTIILTGGTWTGAPNALSNNCTLAGNVTISGIVLYNTGTLLYSSGSIITTDSTLSLNLTAGVNTSTVSWDKITIGGATVVITLGSALVSTGLLTISTTTTLTFAGAYAISAGTCTVSGGLTITIAEAVTISGLTTINTAASVIDGAFHWHTGGLTTTASLTGTTTIVLTGGTWTGAAGSLSNVLVFTGNSTISGTVLCLSPTITWTSGTITAGTSILSLGVATCTFDTNGMSFANITITVAATITINSLLTATGTLTLPNAAVTFAGTAGFTVGTLTHTAITATRIFTFEEAVTYTITTAITATHTAAQTVRYTYTSADGATKAIITLGYGATQNISHLDPTRIDSSLGQPIFSFAGVITTSYNWSNDLGHGRIMPEAGGESVTVAGITKDNAGTALGSCDVYLFRDNGTDTATYIAYVESNAVTGAYSFTVFPGSVYFVVAFKGGATPVMDVTDRTVTAV